MCADDRGLGSTTAICYEAAAQPPALSPIIPTDCWTLWLIQVLYVWSGMSSSSAGAGGAMAAARDRAQRQYLTSERNQYPATEPSQYLPSERTYPQQQQKGFNPDDTLAYPVQIALPDGEEAQNPTSTGKFRRTQEQEEEYKRPYIKPPPNRSVGVGPAEMRYTNIQNVGSSREKEKEYRHSAPLDSRIWAGEDAGRGSPKRGRKPKQNYIDKWIAPFTSPKCDRGGPPGSQLDTGGLTFRPKSSRHQHQSAAPGTGSSMSCPSSSSPPPDVNSPLLVHSGVHRMLEEIPVLSCGAVPHATPSIPHQCHQPTSQCYQHYGMGPSSGSPSMGSGGSPSNYTEDLQDNPADPTDDRGGGGSSTAATGLHTDRTTTHYTQQINIYEHTSSHCISDETITDHDPPPLYYEVIDNPSLYRNRNVSSSRSSRQSEQRTNSGKI